MTSEIEFECVNVLNDELHAKPIKDESHAKDLSDGPEAEKVLGAVSVYFILMIDYCISQDN